MRFQLRIIAVTLAILITTLVLNSVLSLASFEKLYLTSLVSTLELAGKNLKRKIEQALRFGKPFENFKGLDSLLAEVLRDNPEISSVGVTNSRGNILYHTDEDMIGRVFPLAERPFERQEGARTQLVEETYITSISLFDRSDALVGVIHLSFPRAVITRKLQLMATENAKVLWIVVLLTSLGLIVGMTLWVTRPMRGKILEISGRLMLEKAAPGYENLQGSQGEASGNPGEALIKPLEPDLPIEARLLQSDFLGARSTRNELQQLEMMIDVVVRHCRFVLQECQALQEQGSTVATACEELEKGATVIRQLLNHPQVSLSGDQQSRLAQILQENDLLIKELQRIDQGTEGAFS